MTSGGARQLTVQSRPVRHVGRVGRIAVSITIVFAASALVGWLLDVGPLRSVRPGWVSMRPVTAVSMLMLGLSLWPPGTRTSAPRWLRARDAAALVALLFGLVTVIEYALGLRLGVDELLFPARVNAIGSLQPGRMAATAAVSFLLLGCGSLALRRRTPRIRAAAEFLAIAVGVIAALILAGYLFEIAPRESSQRAVPMAVNTALAFLALSVSAVAFNPGSRLLGILTSGAPGGLIVRRVLPMLLVAFLLVGWLGLRAERLGIYSGDFGNAVEAVSAMVLVSLLLLWTATSLNRAEAERGRAEATLKQEQFLTDMLMESIPDAIYFKDAESRFIRVNRALARRFGLSDPAEAIGKTDLDYFAPAHAQAALETEREVMRTGQPAVGIEEMEAWPNRPATWVSSTKMPLRDAAGAIVGTFGISREITARKQAEQALEASEERFRTAFMMVPDAHYIATRDEGRILEVNDNFQDVFGYPRDEAIGRTSLELGLYADPGDRTKMLAELRSKGAVRNLEVVGRRKGGETFPVLLSVSEVRTGDPPLILGVVRDVSQQRSLENQFRQAQRLEAVGRLAGGIAHDFNNVLTAIGGYSELLLADLSPEDAKRRDVEEIRAAAQRAATLTRQLLAFSRKQVLQTRVLDLNTAVRTLDRLLQRLIGEDVKLELALAEPLGAVRADPAQIEQVILNLAVNARDAMPRGGRLTIETANASLDEEYARGHAGAAPGRYVMLAVSDTGEGMDAETLTHLFEPFFTTKTQGKGTGLGLATVYGIVKQSGGYIWVYSEPKRGASFKIYLPQVDESVEAEKAPTPARMSAGGIETVLVAEDDPAVREVVAQTLTQKGYVVLRAPEGQTALELARAHPTRIHLLVTDVVMPGMTGRELASSLAAERPDVRVLFMSGYTDDAVVRHRILEERMPYLQKPFAPDALAAKVREVLDAPPKAPAADRPAL